MTQTGKGLRVLIADDHEAIRLVVGTMVRSYVSNVAPVEVYDNGDDLLLAMLPERGPVGLVVLDLSMPGHLKRLALLKRLLELQPGTPVLVYTASNSSMLMFRAVDMGALGYVVKGSTWATLIRAFESVLMRVPFYDESLDLEEAAHHKWWKLTPAERETMVGLAKGKSLAELADETGRSYKTVGAHKYNATRKLGISAATPLTMYLDDEGLKFELD